MIWWLMLMIKKITCSSIRQKLGKILWKCIFAFSIIEIHEFPIARFEEKGNRRLYSLRQKVNCADAEISGKTLRLSAPDFHSRWEPEDGGRYYRLNGSSDFPFTEKELPNQILDTISSSCKILLGPSYALGWIILAQFLEKGQRYHRRYEWQHLCQNQLTCKVRFS